MSCTKPLLLDDLEAQFFIGYEENWFGPYSGQSSVTIPT
jgi:hypothetical protein